MKSEETISLCKILPENCEEKIYRNSESYNPITLAPPLVLHSTVEINLDNFVEQNFVLQ